MIKPSFHTICDQLPDGQGTTKIELSTLTKKFLPAKNYRFQKVALRQKKSRIRWFLDFN